MKGMSTMGSEPSSGGSTSWITEIGWKGPTNQYAVSVIGGVGRSTAAHTPRHGRWFGRKCSSLHQVISSTDRNLALKSRSISMD